MAHKGIFKPRNPTKYKGDPNNIVYRSWWEFRFMSYLDENKNVLEWASEEIVIPYISSIDGKRHRYFPDFWVKAKLIDNNIKISVIEIKPFHQTQEPKPKKNRNKYLMEAKTYITNQDKWKYAEAFCKKNNWEFMVITEKDLNFK